MYDVPRITFLIVTDVILVAMLVMMLGGCTTPPSRYRHGDYIMNIGSAEPVVAPPTESATKVAAATPQLATPQPRG